MGSQQNLYKRRLGSAVPPRFVTASYDYALPEDLVAQEPPKNRGDSRLLVGPRETSGPQVFQNEKVSDLPQILRPGDLLILNDTRVVPARLLGTRDATGGRAEALVLERHGSQVRVLIGTRGKPNAEETLSLAEGRLRLSLERSLGDGVWEARCDDPEGWDQVLAEFGEMPLPPYIRRAQADERRSLDRERYQTVYAAKPGAAAAPTAGLHLTRPLLDELAARGVRTEAITLHVGLGTFRPVGTPDLRDHLMHAEWYEISSRASEAVADTRAAGGRVVAVGTTVVRALETALDPSGRVREGAGPTTAFIYPPRPVRSVDALLTNFHAPQSTLLMLVSAFAGTARVRAAYRHAVRNRYRFLSYGDAMFLS